jgi:ATP adenylyltransferase
MLEPDTLWDTVARRTERAVRRGALHSINTELRFVDAAGVRFVVRAVPSLARKDRARASEAAAAKSFGRPINPFLPYDEAVFVADVSDTHVCLLNKFNVIDHHLLIVTRAYEDQETLLTRADFEALWACMAEFEGLGFYNAGTVAGASQPHKHLQMVPLPLAPDGPAIPIEPLLRAVPATSAAATIPALPFVHAFARLDPSLIGRPRAAAAATHERYYAMLEAVGLRPVTVGVEPRQSAPYNLLVTRDWMLLVPRSVEFFAGISINALGFAGSFFVRDDEEMRTIEEHGPMAALRAVAVAGA